MEAEISSSSNAEAKTTETETTSNSLTGEEMTSPSSVPPVKRKGRPKRILEASIDEKMGAPEAKKRRTRNETSSSGLNCSMDTASKRKEEKLKNEARSKLFEEIRKTVESSLKTDSSICRIKRHDEVLTDGEITELANSILIEFGDCKKHQIAEFEQCLKEIKREKQKKAEYKRNASKFLKQISDLDAKMKEQEVEKNKKIATMQKDAMAMESKIQQLEKNGTKSGVKKMKELEGLVEQKTKAIEGLKEKLKSAKQKLLVNDHSESKIRRLQKDLENKDKNILKLKQQTTKIADLEESLKSKVRLIEELEAELSESESLVKKLKQAEARESNRIDVKSMLRVTILESEIAVKDNKIKELKSKCAASDERLKLLEENGANFEILKQLREKEGEQFLAKLSEMKSRLQEQNELVETLQWAFYILDKRFGGCSVKKEIWTLDPFIDFEIFCKIKQKTVNVFLLLVLRINEMINFNRLFKFQIIKCRVVSCPE